MVYSLKEKKIKQKLSKDNLKVHLETEKVGENPHVFEVCKEVCNGKI